MDLKILPILTILLNKDMSSFKIALPPPSFLFKLGYYSLTFMMALQLNSAQP